jgi:hypothetical protein
MTISIAWTGGFSKQPDVPALAALKCNRLSRCNAPEGVRYRSVIDGQVVVILTQDDRHGAFPVVHCDSPGAGVIVLTLFHADGQGTDAHGQSERGRRITMPLPV